MTRYLPVLLLVCTLLVAGCDNHAERQPDQRVTIGSETLNQIRTNLKVAQKVWGPVCDGRVPVRRADLPSRSAARASYRFPAGRDDDPGFYYDCRILIRSRGVIADEKLCTLIIHEVGHLAGYRAAVGQWFIQPNGLVDRHHNASRRHIMHPRITRVHPACRTAA